MSSEQQKWTPVLAKKPTEVPRPFVTSRGQKVDQTDGERESAPASLALPPRSAKLRRSVSAGSMKSLTNAHALSGTGSPPSENSVRFETSPSVSRASLAHSSGNNSATSAISPPLVKQRSTLNKFFTMSRTSTGKLDASHDGFASEWPEVTLQLAFQGAEARKSHALKVSGGLTAKEVMEMLLVKYPSKAKRFLAETNITGDSMALQLPLDPPLWLRPHTRIARYCGPECSMPPALLVAAPTPVGGVPGWMQALQLVCDEDTRVFVAVDERALVSDAMAKCIIDAADESLNGCHLFCRSSDKGFWLDAEMPLQDYLLEPGEEVELREPNFVVLGRLQGARYLLNGLSTGESFLRTQLADMRLSTASGVHYSLFREDANNGNLIELPTWQTIARMGIECDQMIRLCRVEEADTPPVPLDSYFVHTVLLSDRKEVLVLDSGPAMVEEPLQSSMSAIGGIINDKRDWHSLLKLSADEDILGKVDAVQLLSTTGSASTGVLCLTNAGLVFKSDKSYIRVFHGMISKIDKQALRAQKKKNKGSSLLESVIIMQVDCKNFEGHSFGLPRHTPKNFFESVGMLAFPRLSSQLYAFSYRLPSSVAPDPSQPDGWHLYQPKTFLERMGIGVSSGNSICAGAEEWALSEINSQYGLCDTYPGVLAFPVRCSTDSLRSSASFRSRGRLPALSYLHRTGASITRCSQPKVGLIGGSSGGDQILLQAILQANPNKDAPVLRLIDARPKLNAIANQAMGKGSERTVHYAFECSLEFANIDNIHVMRQSLVKLHEACRASSAGEVDWNGYQSLLSSSGWLAHVHKVLSAGIKVARYVALDKSSVCLHCSDGWDRTAQLSSLAMLLLDPFYRTIRGMCELIEKEWLAFGHQFARRHGHADGKMDQDGDSQRSPVFLQFLDCTWQLVNLYPCAFEFTGYFLTTVQEEVFNCRFGTFLYDCELQRRDIQPTTVSIWTYILSPSVVDLYRNPLFKPTTDALLNEVPPHAIQLWAEHYCPQTNRREAYDRVREFSMRIEMLEAQLATQKKKNGSATDGMVAILRK